MEYTKEQIREHLINVPAPLLIQRSLSTKSQDFIDKPIVIDMEKAIDPAITLRIVLRAAVTKKLPIFIDARRTFDPQLISQMVDIADRFDFSKILIAVTPHDILRINDRLLSMVAVEFSRSEKL